MLKHIFNFFLYKLTSLGALSTVKGVGVRVGDSVSAANGFAISWLWLAAKVEPAALTCVSNFKLWNCEQIEIAILTRI
jgi:hypothetical protein